MNQRKKIDAADHGSTVMGFIVAIAQAWLGHDWTNFDMTSQACWISAAPTLFLSAIIAVGGYLTRLKVSKQAEE